MSEPVVHDEAPADPDGDPVAGSGPVAPADPEADVGGPGQRAVGVGEGDVPGGDVPIGDGSGDDVPGGDAPGDDVPGGDAPGDDVPPVDAWAVEVLGIELGPPGTGAWLDDRIATRTLPAYERTSATVALARAPGLVEAVAFSRGERTGVREVDVDLSSDEVQRCPEIGSMVAWRNDDVPVISWIELDDATGAVRLVAVAPDREGSEAAVAALVELVEGEASTWRGQVVLLDPMAEGLLVHREAPAGPELPVLPEVVEELDRNVVVPLVRWEQVRDVVPRRAVLLYGPPGSGKHRAVDHVLEQVAGTTVVIVAPRCLLSGDLVRLAFDVAAAAAPALVVVEDLDVVVGDWSSSPAPEGLIELVAQLDGTLRRTGVVTLATTNDGASGALVAWQRTGRFDRLIELGPPPDALRRDVLAELCRRHGAPDEVVGRLMGRTAGWTIGQLAELERLAVLAAAADGGEVDLLAAVDLVRSQVRSHVVPASAVQGQGGSYL